MFNSLDCLIFCAKSIRTIKYSKFFCLLRFILSSVFLSHKLAWRFMFPANTILTLLQPLTCQLYTLSIFHFITHSTQNLKIMNVLEQSKVTKASSSSDVDQKLSSFVSCLRLNYKKKRFWNIVWFCENLFNNVFINQWNSQKVYLSPQNLAFI
jgi:hypothetical protein